MASAAPFEIIVIAYQSREPLTKFLESLGTSIPVIVVDNSVEIDDLSDLLRTFPNVRHVDAGGNRGFSAGANIGARNAGADYLIFMNPDTLPSGPELSRMVEVLEQRPDVASCGATGIGTAGGGALPTIPRVLAHTLGLHRLFPMIGMYFYPRHGERLHVGWISGSCLAIRRSDFEAVGGFDEAYFVFMSDFDLGRRLRLVGRSQLLLGDVTVVHLDGGSSDIPAAWTWDQRGKGWAQYLRWTMPWWRGVSVASILVGGYVGRAGMYTVARRALKRRELSTYARSLVSEWRRLGNVSESTDPT